MIEERRERIQAIMAQNDIGIDLGTTTIIIAQEGKGVVLNQPSVVAGRRDVVNSMMSNIRQNLRYSGLCALLQAGQPPQQLSTEGKSP